jgi:hypothetical protein
MRGGPGHQHAHAWHLARSSNGLLCARRERPRGRRAAEQGNEVPPSQVEHAAPLPEPAGPAYRTLRMPRKRPQVLGEALNRSESRRARPAPHKPPTG